MASELERNTSGAKKANLQAGEASKVNVKVRGQSEAQAALEHLGATKIHQVESTQNVEFAHKRKVSLPWDEGQTMHCNIFQTPSMRNTYQGGRHP